MRWRRELIAEAHGLDWAVAWAFMLGSTFFAIGAFPAYSQTVRPGIVGITFVVGSVLFTSAAYGQFVQVASVAGDGATGRQIRLFAWRPTVLGWWAAVVQLGGTIFFNVNTIDAMIQGLSTEQTNRLVWAPDLFGSVAFLVASHLAWTELFGSRWCVRSDDDGWWTAGLNYLGSIFFMLAAIGSVTLRTTGETLNAAIVNSGTFLGAVCFLVGAYLLLPATSR